MSPESKTPIETPDEPPPILGSWPRVYSVVLGTLFGLVTVFYALTRVYG